VLLIHVLRISELASLLYSSYPIPAEYLSTSISLQLPFPSFLIHHFELWLWRLLALVFEVGALNQPTSFLPTPYVSVTILFNAFLLFVAIEFVSLRVFTLVFDFLAHTQSFAQSLSTT